jgi:16S rRNA U516 pseudouridylate synthase RsuA-like enzyme
MNITLGKLKSGTWRYVTAREMKELNRLLKKNKSKKGSVK